MILDLETLFWILLEILFLCATQIGTVHYSGTIHYAATEVLLGAPAQPKHDLHSFVRVVFCSQFANLRNTLSGIPTTERKAVADFWQQQLASGVWKQAEDASFRTDYNTVIEALCSMLPP